MKAGRWDLTGDPIRFSREGLLLDGQHRLQACAKSGVSFRAVVIRDMDERVQNVLDSGRKRTAADAIAIAGHIQASRMASAARWIIVLKSSSLLPSSAKRSITNREIYDVIEKHPQLEVSAAAVQKALGVTPSILAVTHYIGYYLLNKQQFADEFVAAFSAGKQSYPDDPALVFRERLLRMKERRTYMHLDLVLRGTIHCWNMFQAREESKIFRIPDTVKFVGLDYSKL
jgi:hypothetical protein